jgi:dienelactone hydrolase
MVYETKFGLVAKRESLRRCSTSLTRTLNLEGNKLTPLGWGGKIAALVAAEGTAFKAAAQTHPSLLDPADADVVTIPMMVLPSGDEDVETVKEFERRLKTDKHVETFHDRIHGWTSSK